MKMWLIERKGMNVSQPLLLSGCPIKCSNISTPPLRQWGFRQCLPFSWTTQRGKHCRHPIAVMGVVDTFGRWDFASEKNKIDITF